MAIETGRGRLLSRARQTGVNTSFLGSRQSQNRSAPLNDVELPQRAASRPVSMTPREKAAVIVRLILSEGLDFPIADLPNSTQLALAEQIGKMRPITRATMERVVEEFVAELQDIGLSFPKGPDRRSDRLGRQDGRRDRQRAGTEGRHVQRTAIHGTRYWGRKLNDCCR